MKKSVYALFLMFVCVFLCVGCDTKSQTVTSEQIYQTNAFRIVRQANSVGQISLTYVFPLNTIALSQEGLSEEELKTYKFYVVSYVNALAQANKSKQTEGASVGDCVYFQDVDGVGFSIIFEDLQAQKTFFGVEDDESEKKVDSKTTGFFIQTTQVKTTFPLSSTKSANDIKSVCVMAVNAWSENCGISEQKKDVALQKLDEAVYIYDYACQDTTLKSQFMYEDENFSHNFFVKTADEIDEDNTIVFWVRSANTPVWYMFALGSVLLGMALAYFYLKKKKKI